MITIFGHSMNSQCYAAALGRDWAVLNASLLDHPGIKKNGKIIDEILLLNANRQKNALEEHGPCSTELPDLRQNTGSVKGKIFHAHVHCSVKRSDYVLEWEIIDEEKKIMVLTLLEKRAKDKFSTKLHYGTKEAKAKLLALPESKKILEHRRKTREHARNKLKKVKERHSIIAAKRATGSTP